MQHPQPETTVHPLTLTSALHEAIRTRALLTAGALSTSAATQMKKKESDTRHPPTTPWRAPKVCEGHAIKGTNDFTPLL